MSGNYRPDEPLEDIAPDVGLVCRVCRARGEVAPDCGDCGGTGQMPPLTEEEGRRVHEAYLAMSKRHHGP